jgi:DNA-binding IclR family transcriptional regulator
MIQVIHRALDILELVAKDRNKEYGLGEIADNLKLKHSTCSNIIKTLVNRNYLEQSGKKQGYKLGIKAYYLTGNFSHKEELLRVAADPMRELRNKLNESCVLAVIQGNMRVILHKELSTHELQVVSRREEKNAWMTATGRIILACMNPETRERFIHKYGLPTEEMWPEVKNEDDLTVELEKIRKKQFAIHFDGAYVVGVGIPIYKNDEVLASIGIYLPEVRFTYSMQEQIFSEIQKTANIISSELSRSIK